MRSMVGAGDLINGPPGTVLLYPPAISDVFLCCSIIIVPIVVQLLF